MFFKTLRFFFGLERFFWESALRREASSSLSLPAAALSATSASASQPRREGPNGGRVPGLGPNHHSDEQAVRQQYSHPHPAAAAAGVAEDKGTAARVTLLHTVRGGGGLKPWRSFTATMVSSAALSSSGWISAPSAMDVVSMASANGPACPGSAVIMQGRGGAQLSTACRQTSRLACSPPTKLWRSSTE